LNNVLGFPYLFPRRRLDMPCALPSNDEMKNRRAEALAALRVEDVPE